MISATVGVTSLYAGGTVQASGFAKHGARGGSATWWASCSSRHSSSSGRARHGRSARSADGDDGARRAHSLRQRADLPQQSAARPDGRTPFHQADLLVAILLWAAIRFGLRGATSTVLVVSAAAIVATARGYGPFVLPELSERLLLLQTFMAIVATTCLMFGATIAERHIANQMARERGWRPRRRTARRRSSCAS